MCDHSTAPAAPGSLTFEASFDFLPDGSVEVVLSRTGVTERRIPVASDQLAPEEIAAHGLAYLIDLKRQAKA